MFNLKKKLNSSFRQILKITDAIGIQIVSIKFNIHTQLVIPDNNSIKKTMK